MFVLFPFLFLRPAPTHAGTQLQAIEHLKAFEKKDQHLKAMAATNLAFIYFLEGRCGRPLRNVLLYDDILCPWPW